MQHRKRTGKTSRSAWKFVERKTAKLFGTDRVPLSGAAKSLKTSSDSLHQHLYIECKSKEHHRYKLLFTRYDELHKRSYSVKKVRVKNKKGLTKEVDKKTYHDSKAHLLLIRRKNERGFLICFHTKDFDFVMNNYSWPINKDIFHFEAIVQAKLAVITLYKDSAEKAEIENKIPLLVIKRKYERGEYYVTNPTHLSKIAEFYGGNKRNSPDEG